MNPNILITGGAGFIGSNFARYLHKLGKFENIIILDKLTYAGNQSTIDDIIANQNVSFVKGDINDSVLLLKLLQSKHITHIAHFAAESHVDNSIISPKSFLETNIIGTYSLLQSFMSHWKINGCHEGWRFLHVSTDEVYGSLDEHDPPFSEKTAYAPRSPYAASKAASDHLVMAWHNTYGIPAIITNCSNNYGPWQYPEKLIPVTISSILNKIRIPIYGNGMNVRDWLHVDDHCKALEKILFEGGLGRSYSIGGGNQISNISLVKMICNIVDEIRNLDNPMRSTDLIEYVSDRPGHDQRYCIDYSLLRDQLGWEPTIELEDGIRQTVTWYLRNRKWWETFLLKTTS